MRMIIIGCGRMGAGLAGLLGSRGHAVTVVDRDGGAMARLDPSFQGRTIVGTGFDREVLLAAGIERADGLAAVTDSDDTNVVVSRLGRQVFRVPRVVARLYDPRKIEVYRRLGVQVVDPGSWAFNRFADLLSYSQLDTILSLGSGEVEIVEMDVPLLLAGRKVSAITVPGEVHIVALSRKGRVFLPTSETVFRKDDSMHIALLTASAERLKAMLAMA